jgi:sugar O-acyltransferase (sialic acid O-acetyltransferase NeuD family)
MGKLAVTQGNGVRAGGSVTRLPVRPGTLPPDVRRILIVGAGGFGREVLQWARDAWPEACDRITGFLSADAHVLDGCDCGIRIVGSPDSHRPVVGDVHLLAIGVPYARRRVAESLIARGAEFLTLVHPTGIIATSAHIGEGSIICPYSIVSDSARVGRFVAMNYHSSLGHDASAGDFAVLSPYATLGGNAHVGADVFLGLHSSVGPGVWVGSGSKVSANSTSLHNAPENSLVYGTPGRVVPHLEIGRTSS